MFSAAIKIDKGKSFEAFEEKPFTPEKWGRRNA
jgi:hypothetical protein